MGTTQTEIRTEFKTKDEMFAHLEHHHPGRVHKDPGMATEGERTIYYAVDDSRGWYVEVSREADRVADEMLDWTAQA